MISLCDSVPQDDDDGHLLSLQIIRDLVDKGGDVFLDQLARLGVINKVSTLAGPVSDDENEDETKPEKVCVCVCVCVRRCLFSPASDYKSNEASDFKQDVY